MAPGVVLTFMLTWELASRAGLLSTLLFPAPSQVAVTSWNGLVSGELLLALGTTTGRLLRGLTLGASLGLVVGAVAGWSRKARAMTDPLIAMIHPIPKLALLPFFMIVFGLGDAPRIVVVAIAAFFPMAISTLAGVAQISDIHHEVAADYGASTRVTLTRVVLPGTLPAVLAGFRLAFNTALHVTVAVELVGASTGLGSVIWFAWETLRIEHLYAAIVLLSLLGIGSNHAIERFHRWAIPWSPQRQRSPGSAR